MVDLERCRGQIEGGEADEGGNSREVKEGCREVVTAMAWNGEKNIPLVHSSNDSERNTSNDSRIGHCRDRIGYHRLVPCDNLVYVRNDPRNECAIEDWPTDHSGLAMSPCYVSAEEEKEGGKGKLCHSQVDDIIARRRDGGDGRLCRRHDRHVEPLLGLLRSRQCV